MGMTHREFARAAQQAVACLDDGARLAANALFLACSRPPGELRAIVVSALAALTPSLYEIIVRCDLRGEAPKDVCASMGLSRRHFCRKRRYALAELGKNVRQSIDGAGRVSAARDAAEAGILLLEALRSAGQYEAAWGQARALAQHSAGEVREAKLWIIATEAARYLCRPQDAALALEKARIAQLPHLDGDQAYLLTLWQTIGELNLRWADADLDGARALFDLAGGPDERALAGDKASLYAVMLGYAARMEFDSGNWERARSLLARASGLAERVANDFHRRFAMGGQSLLRLRAELALRADGDVARSLVEYQAALSLDESLRQTGGQGISAAGYACALDAIESPDALRRAEYGLDVVRRYYHGDRLARVTLDVLPLLAREKGVDRARRAVAELRRDGLGLRDRLLLDLAEAKIAAYANSWATSAERADAVADQLTEHGMHAWACEARLVALEALVHCGDQHRSRIDLANLYERLDAATAQTRSRFRALRASRLRLA